MSSGVTGSEGTATDDDDKPPEAGTADQGSTLFTYMCYHMYESSGVTGTDQGSTQKTAIHIHEDEHIRDVMKLSNSAEGATCKQLTMAMTSFANLLPDVVVTAAQTAVHRATQAAKFSASPEELLAVFNKVFSLVFSNSIRYLVFNKVSVFNKVPSFFKFNKVSIQ